MSSMGMNSETRPDVATDRWPAPTPRRRRFSIKAWLWKLLTFPFLAVIYCSVISDGLRRLVPELGRPLWRAVPIPGFSQLRNYEGLHKLDLAFLLALLLLFAVWYLWVVNLRLFLAPREISSRWTFHAYRNFVMGLSLVILIADGCLFYYAMVHQGVWGSASILSVPALLATAAYTAILIFVSWVTVNLEE